MTDNRIKEYDEFRENLKKQFDNKDNPIYFSYLIDESYMKELEKYIDYLRGNKNKSSNKSSISSPKIFNNFESAMNNLKQNKKINIISKNMINLISPNYNLNKCKTVTILGGNGKLIIYFDDKNDKNAFLLFKNKSSNKNQVELNNNYAYIIHKEIKNKLQFYADICKQEFDFNQINNKHYDYIFSFNDFNSQKIGKYHNDGKKNVPKENFSDIKYSDNKRYNSSKYKTTVQGPIKIKEKSNQLDTSVERKKNNYHMDSNKNNNINSIVKKLTFNKAKENEIDKLSIQLSIQLKEIENQKMENDVEIQRLKNENLKLENKIKEIKIKQKEIYSHFKRLSSNNLSGIQIKSRDSTKLSYISRDYVSNKQIRNESIEQKINAFSTRRDTKNEIMNQQKTNNNNNCEIIKKKSDENYTQLQISHAYKRKKMKSELKNKLPNVSIKSFPNPTLVKLDYVKIKLPNYIYSIIYCLSQIDDLTNYFLTGNCIQPILKNEHSDLSLEYDYLIHGLWPTKNNGNKFWPNTFMEEMNKMSKEHGLPYESNDPNDIHYFIVFILEQLHRELKSSKNRNNKQKEVQYNQYDENNIIKYIDDFKEESSIISKLFFGFKETTEECLNCNKKANLENKILCYNYEMFNCLVFPLDEIKNEINSNNVTIIDCFNYIQKTQLFTGDKRNYCKKCEQVYDSNFTTTIYEFPEVLILVFVRNKESGNNVKLYFEEKINTRDLNSGAEVNTGIVFKRQIYDLCGVISYKEGKFIDYTASCKSPVDKSWYRCTSSEITPIDDVENDIINYETPYVLFYKKGK